MLRFISKHQFGLPTNRLCNLPEKCHLKGQIDVSAVNCHALSKRRLNGTFSAVNQSYLENLLILVKHYAFTFVDVFFPCLLSLTYRQREFLCGVFDSVSEFSELTTAPSGAFFHGMPGKGAVAPKLDRMYET